MDTAPLPPVAPSGRGRRTGPAADPPRRPVVPGRGLRAVEVVAGLLSGGLLIVGVALLVLQFVAPDLAPGSGLSAASGPGWWRVALQLGVGVAGELAVLGRRWWSRPARWLAAPAVIVAVLVALWLAWWD